jgi:hypothetical protein
MATERRSLAEWKQLLHECERSGLSQREFCRRREINYWTFLDSKKRLVAQESSGGFVEIRSREAPAVAGSMRLSVAGVAIEVSGSVDEAQLAAVLRAARLAAC